MMKKRRINSIVIVNHLALHLKSDLFILDVTFIEVPLNCRQSPWQSANRAYSCYKIRHFSLLIASDRSRSRDQQITDRSGDRAQYDQVFVSRSPEQIRFSNDTI